MRDALEDATGRDLDIVTEDDLADVRMLQISDAGELKKSDFSGLSNLQRLDLGDDNLSELPPGAFDGLSNLQEPADLGGNNLSELPPGVFDGLSNLQELDLGVNPGTPFRITHPNANLRGSGWER